MPPKRKLRLEKPSLEEPSLEEQKDSTNERSGHRQKKARKEVIEQLYDVGTDYVKSIHKKIDGNGENDQQYCRAHFFPKSAYQKIVTNSNSYNQIPYIIIPRDLEEWINKNIKDYAKAVTDTGEVSRKGTKGLSAIYNDSEFAKQHPGVYLNIFENCLSTHLHLLEEGDAKEKLRDNISLGIEGVKNLSNAYKEKLKDKGLEHDVAGLFGISDSQMSRTKSGERKVKTDCIHSPENFKTFINSETEEAKECERRDKPATSLKIDLIEGQQRNYSGRGG